MDEKQADRKAMKSEIADRYFSVLKKMGLQYEIDEDGDIEFQPVSGKVTFVAVIDSKHPEYVRICLPNLYYASDDERVKVLEACNSASRNGKVSKAYLNGRDQQVWVAYEASVPDLSQEMIEFSLKHSLASIHSTAAVFLSSLKNQL